VVRDEPPPFPLLLHDVAALVLAHHMPHCCSVLVFLIRAVRRALITIVHHDRVPARYPRGKLHGEEVPHVRINKDARAVGDQLR